MGEPVMEITLGRLMLALGLVGVSGVCSLLLRLDLGRDLLIGTVRSTAQLFLMGYVLTLVFGHPSIWLTLGLFSAMVTFAVRIIRGRVDEREVSVTLPTFLSMFTGYLLVSILVTGVVVGVEPWWQPAYFIPLAGMIVGNSMTAVSISLERLFTDMRSQRGEIEMMLCLGATPREAAGQYIRDAVKAGMIPSINSMMGVGIVFIPGMMTGQILAGADPLTAIRYQIVVMLMLTASTALGSVMVIHLTVGRCFGKSQALVFSRAGGRR